MKAQLEQNENGIVLITTMAFLAVMLAMFAAYYKTTAIELATTRYVKDSVSGFYIAEAGLNIRAEEIRAKFVGYNKPTGTTPNLSNACSGSNVGSVDFMCKTYSFGKRKAESYVIEDTANPIITTIPVGELYQGLNAQEYRYTVRSISKDVEDKIGTILELRFKSRLVPLFQFVAFYDKDLEILPGPSMNLSGPIHTNGDLYLNANNQLSIAGQVTTAGDLYRGRKNNTNCNSKPVTVLDPVNPLAILPSCPTRTVVPGPDLDPWNGMIQSSVDILTVPDPGSLDPSPGQVYWDNADIRIVLHLNGNNNPDASNATNGVEIRNADNTVNTVATDLVNKASECPGAGCCNGAIGETSNGSNDGEIVNRSYTFYNNRESATIDMLELDMTGLLNCVHNNNLLLNEIFEEGRALDDDSDGGLVVHLSVDGPDSDDSSNNYGVRIRNAESLQSSIVTAPQVLGMTVVSDQAMYIHGDYNSTNKIPAAVLTDALNPLSNVWNLNDMLSLDSNVNNRVASNTAFNAAVMSGTNTTGGTEGAGGQGGTYNGGLENYPRFHEKWSGKTFTYRGSFVSLGNSRHQDGAWVYGNPQYKAPNRDWDYDTDFNDAANLPPLTPRFVYLKQELFVRKFEQ